MEIDSANSLSLQVFDGYKNKVKNRLFGLLCEREKDGQWEKFLDTIYIELMGYAMELNSINYWMLLGKIASLRYLSLQYFRKTVFECMNLIKVLSLSGE